MTKWNLVMVCLTSTLGLVISACNKGNDAKPAETAAKVALPSDLFAASAPTASQSVKEAKAAAQVDKGLTVRGRIGGGRDPFASDLALFTLADLSLPPCTDDMNCKTPWDYCCETPDKITEHAMTVQVVGADGKPLKTAIKGVNGLSPMAVVTVEGRVSQKLEGNIVVLDATRIYVEPAT